MMNPKSLLVCVLGLLVGDHSAKAASQVPFLREILIGRCYARPVDAKGGPGLCPSLVDSLIGAFAGKLDQDVQVHDFDPYLQVADFSSPENGALFVVNQHNGGETDDSYVKNHMRPEDTRGGSIVAGISFCANDKRTDCPGVKPPNDKGEFVGTESALWAGIYQAFAKQVKGQLSIAVLQPDVDDSLVTKAAVPKLESSSVSMVHIFLQSGDCDSSVAVAQVKDALEKVGITSDCVKDPYLLDLALCTGQVVSEASCGVAKRVVSQVTDTENKQTNKTNQENHNKSHIWAKCSFIIVLAAGIAFFFSKRRNSSKNYQEIPIVVDQ